MKNNKKSLVYIVLALSVILIIGGVTFLLKGNNINLDFSLENLRGYVEGKEYIEVIFIVLWSLRLLLFIPGVTLMLLGGLIFMPGKAFTLSLIGILISDSLVFFVAKSSMFKNFRENIARKNPDLIDLIETYNYKILFVGVLCPVAPTDVLVFLSSYLGMSYKKFLSIFTLANIPALLLYSYLGESFEGSIYNTLFIVGTLIASGLLTIKLWNDLRGKLKSV